MSSIQDLVCGQCKESIEYCADHNVWTHTSDDVYLIHDVDQILVMCSCGDVATLDEKERAFLENIHGVWRASQI